MLSCQVPLWPFWGYVRVVCFPSHMISGWFMWPIAWKVDKLPPQGAHLPVFPGPLKSYRGPRSGQTPDTGRSSRRGCKSESENHNLKYTWQQSKKPNLPVKKQRQIALKVELFRWNLPLDELPRAITAPGVVTAYGDVPPQEVHPELRATRASLAPEHRKSRRTVRGAGATLEGSVAEGRNGADPGTRARAVAHFFWGFWTLNFGYTENLVTVEPD